MPSISYWTTSPHTQLMASPFVPATWCCQVTPMQNYLNVRKARSRAGAHIMLSKDIPVPRYNRPVLTIAQIIKCEMSSAAEAELTGLYICAKEMVPLRQSLVKMGWPQPQSPIQCDNSTAIGAANETITPRKKKSMDMQFHWMRCRDA